MSGYANRGKVMKKTLRVPMLSRGPVLQSCGNLVDNSGNLSRNMGQNEDENGHTTVPVPVYRLAQEPILPSVSLAMYQCILAYQACHGHGHGHNFVYFGGILGGIWAFRRYYFGQITRCSVPNFSSTSDPNLLCHI